jgi:hypothetical protein
MTQPLSSVLQTITIALSAVPVFAGYAESFPIRDLVNRSDLIVVGPIQSGTLLPSTTVL